MFKWFGRLAILLLAYGWLPLALAAGSCELFFDDFSGSYSHNWLFDQPGEWSSAGGRLTVTPVSDNYWAIAETDLQPNGDFILDADVTCNNANGIQALYVYTDGGTRFSLEGHAIDGVAVVVYPLQDKMIFTFWDLDVKDWVSTDYLDIPAAFSSFGLHFTATTVTFRLDGRDTPLSLQGGFSPVTAINKLWLAASGVDFQGTFDNVCVRSDDVAAPAYDNFSYVPYCSNLSSFQRWTGLALTNRAAATNQVLVEYYSAAGSLLNSETKSLPALGQTSFAAQLPAESEGWIKVSSTEPLSGLALVGQSYPESLFDMDLTSELYTSLKLPHLAADASAWASMLMLCNPNPAATTVTLRAYDRTGSNFSSRSADIPANGSLQGDLYSIFASRTMEGSMTIESSRPLTAFLLYTSRENSWRAGLSAVPVQ